MISAAVVTLAFLVGVVVGIVITVAFMLFLEVYSGG
jgi:hypothetical protein